MRQNIHHNRATSHLCSRTRNQISPRTTESQQSPHWQRVDRASEVLFQLYMRTDGTDAAPVLTSLGVIQWWEGHGSKAHECFQRALESDPEYRLAQLTDHLVREGIVSDWATDKQTAYQPPHTRGPEIGGMGL
ncbi:DUF4192 family protein [Arthrobacter sp. TMP15]|uniref:DUF4192 family protein n=1 Tax=Arthrobacter sp. TMP15 TaxID=3140789 RepID=UPI0031BA1BCE